MFEQTFKNIDDILYKDAGADSELDYYGQTTLIISSSPELVAVNIQQSPFADFTMRPE